MSDFKTFPADKYEALALLYLQNQDLSGLTPEEVYDKYEDSYRKIRLHKSAASSSQKINC